MIHSLQKIISTYSENLVFYNLDDEIERHMLLTNFKRDLRNALINCLLQESSDLKQFEDFIISSDESIINFLKK